MTFLELTKGDEIVDDEIDIHLNVKTNELT